MLVNGDQALSSMTKSSLINGTFTVGMVDFDFDLEIETREFYMIIEGRSYQVNGTRLNAQTKKAINQATSGTIIQIGEIVAKVKGSSYELPEIFGSSIRIR